MSSYRKTMREAREEMLVISEAKYELYHKDFSTAMQHAYKMAKKLHGITVDPKEIDDKVASGPRKPSEGKTNSYRLEGDKGSIQVQVYNKGGPKPFELNFYKEEVDLDEGTKQVLAHGGKGQYKAVRDGGITKIMYKGKVVGTADFDSGADSFFVSMKGVKGQKSFDDAQAMVDYFAKNKITEEVELDEKLDQNDKPTVNNVVKMLNKASKAHAGQAKDLKKAVETEEAELDEIVGALAKVAGVAAKGAAKVGGAVARKIAPAAKVGAKKGGSAVKKSGAAVRKDFVGGFGDAAGTQAAKADAALEKKAKRNESLNVSEAEDFKPHMMYDPKTGKGYKAEKEEDHLRMKKMGYVHEKPKVKSEAYQLDEKIAGLVKKADKSGMPYGILKKVYDRGMAAWKTGHRPGTTPQQWAFARVNSFITKGSGTWGKADKDLASQVREALEIGDEIDESLWANIAAKRKRIKAGSGEKMRKKGEKGAPTSDQMAKAKNEGAASDARRAMAADPSTKQKFSKNISATDDDVKSADKNIMMQMRKAVSLRGNKVEFMDKKKVMIPQKIAQAVIAKYNSMKKPADKEKFQSKISKSYKSMLTTLKEHNEINNTNNSLHELKSLAREMKGKNNG